MSNGALRLLAGAGAKDDPVYVDDVFSTFLYKGTGSSLNIVTDIDLSGEGGLVWTKSRTSSVSNQLTDTVSGYRLESDDTAAGEASQGNVTFNSNGHTQASGSSFFNDSSNSFVNWSFRMAPGFFDIQTYTGSGENGQTINHDLDAVPGMVIIKQATGASNWYVYHRSLDSGKHLKLNKTDAESSDDNYEIGKTTCTSTQFSIDTGSEIDASGQTYVAYFFAHDDQRFGTDEDEAIIKCGSYTGNGSATGPVIDLGFEPQFILMRYPAGANWYIYDSMRGIVSGQNEIGLNPNATGTGFDHDALSLTASGFQITTTNGNYNGNGNTYIYVAIRRPHKPAEEFVATNLFNVDAGDANDPGFDTGFPVDMGFFRTASSTADFDVVGRLNQGRRLDITRGTEANKANARFDYNDGWMDSSVSMANHTGWAWRRAPGFFDVVCYAGTGGSVWHNHNLGVVPEMIICKGRDIAEYWNVFTTAGGTSSRLHLDEGNEYITNNASQFFPTLPTATQFRIGQNNEIGGSGYNYIAYLFASVAGISKLGTYTGTGSAQDIDCGFSAGARFVLIKRVDVAGYWLLWDSVRGIVAGNDPYLVLNSSAAEVTNTDYIDPLSSGFTITSSAPTDNSDTSMNKSGGTYFFYAIA